MTTTTTTMNDTRAIFASLRNLTAARDSLPMDWARFNAEFGDITDADSLEELESRAVAATIAAYAQPLTEEQARTVGDLLGALADAMAEAEGIPAADLCVLLRELVAAGDLDGLGVALDLVPYNGRAYVEHLRALADATKPGEPNDAARLRAEQVKALQASAKPGETPHQRAVRQAFKEARRLIDLHGDEDPRAFIAITKALNLQEPGCTDRLLKRSGINLPKPDRCADDGTPLYSLDAIAEALDADPVELLAKARELEGLGLGVLHVGDNTHALQ